MPKAVKDQGFENEGNEERKIDLHYTLLFFQEYKL